MEQSIERMTATRFKLEEKFYQVTFLRTDQETGHLLERVAEEERRIQRI